MRLYGYKRFAARPGYDSVSQIETSPRLFERKLDWWSLTYCQTSFNVLRPSISLRYATLISHQHPAYLHTYPAILLHAPHSRTAPMASAYLPFLCLTATVPSLHALSIRLILVIIPIKISVILFYKRIFTTKLFRHCIWVAIGIVLAWGVASLVVCSNRSISALFPKFYWPNHVQQAQLLIADPVPSAAWKDLENAKYGFNYFKFGMSVPVLSIFFDAIILLFPLAPLRKLQMPNKRKIAIIGTFWLDSLDVIRVFSILFNNPSSESIPK